MILVDEVVNKEDDGRLNKEVFDRELELGCEEGFVEQRSQICMYVHVGGRPSHSAVKGRSVGKPSTYPIIHEEIGSLQITSKELFIG